MYIFQYFKGIHILRGSIFKDFKVLRFKIHRGRGQKVLKPKHLKITIKKELKLRKKNMPKTKKIKHFKSNKNIKYKK